jgi:SAM-dependent methyltransferase
VQATPAPPTADTDATRACPVCESAACREDEIDDVILYRCPRCDHCFTDVDALEYLGAYDEAWEALHPNWFANPNTELFEFIRLTIERHKRDAAVIDVGAGRGELLEYLRGRSPELALTGNDVSLHPTIDGVEFVVGDIATTDTGSRRWDVATSLATIEHVADVRGFVQRLRELVVPDGLLIVMTIDERSLLYETARILRRVGYGTAYERLYDRHHLNHFNATSLRTLLDRSGLEIVEVHRHNIPIAAVDMPKESNLLRLGVWGTFALGRLTGRTYEQTLVCRNR